MHNQSCVCVNSLLGVCKGVYAYIVLYPGYSGFVLMNTSVDGGDSCGWEQEWQECTVHLAYMLLWPPCRATAIPGSALWPGELLQAPPGALGSGFPFPRPAGPLPLTGSPWLLGFRLTGKLWRGPRRVPCGGFVVGNVGTSMGMPVPRARGC